MPVNELLSEIEDLGASPILVMDLDRPRLDEALLAALEAAMDEVDARAGAGEIAGLLIRPHRRGLPDGPDPEIVLACEKAEDLIALGHRGAEIARRLERLPVPVVAILRGRCRDIGLELALAAHHRIGKEGGGLRLGLPGVDAATPPIFGGMTRLCQFAGLGRGLELILERQELGAKAARAAGLIDELVPEAELEAAGCAAIASLAEDWRAGRHRRRGRFEAQIVEFLSERSALFRKLEIGRFRRRARDLERPIACVQRLLDVVEQGLALPRFERLEREVQACAEWLADAGPRNRLSLLSRSEPRRRGGAYAPSGARVALPRSAAIMAATRVGTRLALGFLGRGLRVSVFEADPEKLVALGREIDAALAAKVEKGRLRSSAARRVRDRLLLAPEPVDLSDVDLVIDCSEESDAEKTARLAALIEITRPSTLLVTHSTTLSPSLLHRDLPTDRRLQVMHFLRPEESGGVCEIVRDRESHHADLAVLARLVREIGSFPLITGGEPPFAAGRMVTIFCCSALQLLAEGYSPRTIDRAATEFGFTTGPLALLDLVGLDVVSLMARRLEGEPIVGFKTPEVLDILVARGETGARAGLGIRDWSGGRPRPRHEGELRNVGKLPPMRIEQRDRRLIEPLLMPLSFEARRMLDMKAVENPHELDLASVHAIGFPKERGGLATHVTTAGAEV